MDIKLSIRVHEEGRFFGDGLETRDEGSTVASVDGMIDKAYARITSREVGDNLFCAVLAAIIDDDHFKITQPMGEGAHNTRYRALNDGFLSTGNSSFQTFLGAVSRFSVSYSQEYNAVFSRTGALLLSLMTWCSAIFFLLGFVAAWGISRCLPEF